MLRRTDLGKAMRAAAEDAPIAAAFGVNQQRAGADAVGHHAALAGVAGVCIALAYTLSPSQIYAWIGVVFAAVMLGGLGSPLGPLVAGCIIGVTEARDDGGDRAVVGAAGVVLAADALLLLVRPGEGA